MHLVCHHCFAINRIPEGKDHTQARCGKCGNNAFAHRPVDLVSNTFHHYIEKNDLPIIVDFWASWCGPCQNMAPVFQSVARQSDTLLFAKVNTETEQHLAAEAQIRSLPTLVIFFHGKEIDRISGGLSEPQLKQWIMQTIEKL